MSNIAKIFFFSKSRIMSFFIFNLPLGRPISWHVDCLSYSNAIQKILSLGRQVYLIICHRDSNRDCLLWTFQLFQSLPFLRLHFGQLLLLTFYFWATATLTVNLLRSFNECLFSFCSFSASIPMWMMFRAYVWPYVSNIRWPLFNYGRTHLTWPPFVKKIHI